MITSSVGVPENQVEIGKIVKTQLDTCEGCREAALRGMAEPLEQIAADARGPIFWLLAEMSG